MKTSDLIIIFSIIGFVVITTFSVFVYFQTTLPSVGIDCFFPNNSLLNYLHNPQCDRPLGIELWNDFGCVTNFDRRGFTQVECEEPEKAWIERGCLYVNLDGNNTLTNCG